MATPELQTADTALLTNILQEAVFTAQEKSIAGSLFSVYDMTSIPGLTAQIPVYPSISATAPGQTTDLDDTAVAVGNITISASEIGARIDVSDLLAESTARNMGSDVGQMLGSAIAEKIDVDAFGIFTEAAITTNVVGSSTGEITPETILQAVYKLRNVNAPTDASGDYFAVLHPGQAFNLAKVLTQAGYAASVAPQVSDVGNVLLSSSAYVGRLFNVKIFQSTSIAADSANGAFGAVFSPMAAAHVLKRNLRLETQRNASLRSTEYVATTARGNGILKESYACLVRGDKLIN
jgi:N4-gp56 family major capsid protein